MGGDYVSEAKPASFWRTSMGCQDRGLDRDYSSGSRASANAKPDGTFRAQPWADHVRDPGIGGRGLALGRAGVPKVF